MPLKIVHFSSAKTWRGGEQQIVYLYEELARLGSVQWIACPRQSDLERYCIQNKIPHLSYKKGFSFNPIPARQIAHFCKQNKVDVLHLHDSHAHTFGVMSAALFGNPSKMVLSRRVIVPIAKSLLSNWKYNHSSIQKIICVSDAIQAVAAPNIKEVHKLETVHSGIDFSKFHYQSNAILRKQYQIPDALALVGKVAAIGHLKDYFTFVKTVKILVEKGLKAKYLIIGGDSGAETEIRTFVKAEGLENEIIFTGFRKDIPQILPELDVFLFTSKSEGLGTSILDAMACEVPVVATRAGGIPEIIEDGHSGFLAAIGDAATLADKVETLLENPLLYKEIVGHANQKITQFSKETMAKKTLDIYNKLCSV